MALTFNDAIERVLAHEGGYVNHPSDPGGETKWGVTKRTARANGYHKPMRQMTREEAKAIYKRAFWRGCARFEGALAFQLFDAIVNHGRGNAYRFLQRAANVADDGVIGPVTLAAVRRLPLSLLVARFLAERLRFYTNLSMFETFGRGWTRRVATNLRYAVEDGCDQTLLQFADTLENFVKRYPRFGGNQRMKLRTIAREF